MRDGIIQRENGLPAIEFRNNQQDVTMKWWFTDGEHRRIGGPHIVFDDGTGYQEFWRPYNPDGPSKIFKRNGILRHECWKNEHGSHRDGAPASIEIDADTGVVTQELWFQNGIQHREDGPAVILRDVNTGEIHTERHYKNGRQQRALLNSTLKPGLK